MKRLLALLIFLTAPAWASTYYVDCAADPGGDGTTTATSGEHAAWDLVADVNAVSFSAGDSILFKKGCTWRETLTVPSSGSSGNPITFGAYGSGTDPIISGADLKSWSVVTGNTGDLTSLDFEEGNLDDFASTYTNGNTTIAASSTQAAAGTWSAAISSTDGTGTAYGITDTITEMQVGNTYYIRFYVFPPAGAWAASTTAQVITMRDGTTDRALLSFETNSSGNISGIRVYMNQWLWTGQAITINIGQWNQVEVAFTCSATVGGAEVWINGVSVRSDLDQNTSASAGCDNVKAGPDSANKIAAGKTVYWDAIDIATTGPIGTLTQNLWKATQTEDPLLVIFGDVFGTKVASQALVNSANKWYWDDGDNLLYVYSVGDPTASVQVPVRDNCLDIDGKSFITLDGLSFRGSRYRGCVVEPTSADVTGVVIQHCTAELNYAEGFCSPGGAYQQNGTQYLENLARYNGATGIGCAGDILNFVFSKNISHHNGMILSGLDVHMWTGGIKVYRGDDTASNILIQKNLVYSNGPTSTDTAQGIGIWVDSCNAVTVSYNMVYDNTSCGIVFEGSDDSRCLYNVLYGNASDTYAANLAVVTAITGSFTTSGNFIYGNTVYGGYWGLQVQSDNVIAITNNIFKNNIFIGGLVHSTAYIINGGENAGCGSGNVYEYNHFGPEFDGFIKWGATFYSTYDDWETAYGGSTHSVEADPLFTNAAGGDFTLQATSPCIEAGVNLGTAYDDALLSTSIWPDNVVVGDQDLYGASWELGAYLYGSISYVTVNCAVNGAGAITVIFVNGKVIVP